MGLADDITDRTLDAHKAELAVRKASASGPISEEPHSRIDSQDTTLVLCKAIRTKGMAPKYYGLTNGGVNQAVIGMPTKAYIDVQLSLKEGEAPKQAFIHSMLHMKGTQIDCLVRESLAGGSNADDQLDFMQSKGAMAAEVLGLHKISTDVQPSNYIISNNGIMSAAMSAEKKSRLWTTCGSNSLNQLTATIQSSLRLM